MLEQHGTINSLDLSSHFWCDYKVMKCHTLHFATFLESKCLLGPNVTVDV